MMGSFPAAGQTLRRPAFGCAHIWTVMICTQVQLAFNHREAVQLQGRLQ